MPALERDHILAFRAAAHGLGDGASLDDDPTARVLDVGVQDTGPSGARWGLALRGDDPGPGLAPERLALVWAARGAPHVVRRADLPALAGALTPWSEADAAKRIFDAAKPLRDAGIPVTEALATIAAAMADIVTTPTAKGELSAELTARLDGPYLRSCRPCNATHTFEQPFRLSALAAGLELTPDTSPPVLRPIPGWPAPAERGVSDRLDPLTAQLRVNGPLTPGQLATNLDAAQADVRRRLDERDDLTEVAVDGDPEKGRRWVHAADAAALAAPPEPTGVRLLDPFDPFLQTRDRGLLVPDEAARKDLWRVLGRPGGVWVDGDLVGSWRPRSAGKRLRILVTGWAGGLDEEALAEQATRLAQVREQTFAGFVDE